MLETPFESATCDLDACVFVSHPLSFWIFISLWVICLVEEHSGHDVWWSPHKFLPFSMGGGAAPRNIIR